MIRLSNNILEKREREGEKMRKEGKSDKFMYMYSIDSLSI